MFGRFIVLTTFLMVSSTALMGAALIQGFICNDDRCCYPEGRCFPRDDLEEEAARRTRENRLGATPPRSAPQSPSTTDNNIGKAGSPPPSNRILETGYAKLGEVGEEKPGYGLYSYVLITSNSSKSVALLSEIFKVIPNVKDAGASPKQINILYIPFLKEKENEFVVATKSIEHARREIRQVILQLPNGSNDTCPFVQPTGRRSQPIMWRRFV